MAIEKFSGTDTADAQATKLNKLLAALGLDTGDTIAPTALPIATETTLGVVSIGTGISVDEAGEITPTP